MERHHGRVIELTIRKKGLNITEVPRLSNVNRRTVYNWFNQKYVKPDIMYQLGQTIKHDFSAELPDLFSKGDFKDHPRATQMGGGGLQPEESPGNQIWKDRYLTLLENYNKLLLYCTAAETDFLEMQPV
jgi:hypothetical protein